MKQDVFRNSLQPIAGMTPELEQIAEAARFPAENPNPVFRVAADGRLLYANRASKSLLVAWGVADDGCVPAQWRQRIADVLAAGEAHMWDAQCHDRVLQLHCIPILSEGFVNVYAADVTERVALLAQVSQQATLLRQTRDELAKRVEELEALLDLLPVGIAISSDPECKDIRVNHALARALGMPHDANVSLGAGESRDWPPYRVLDQAGRELSVEELPMQTAAGRGIEVREMVIDILRANGERLPMLSYATPLLDKAGKPRGAVAGFVDISGLRAAEVEKLAYQARLLENVNDAILAFDPDLRVTAWNRKAEEQYGWTAEEAIGAYAPEVVGSQLTEDERADIMRTLAEAGRWRGEIRHTRRDGTPLIVEATSMALRDEAGHNRGFVTVNRDITQRKKAETQAARLLEELRASREQLQALSRRLVTMQESERSYVADQLYNQAGQVLAALQMQLSRLGRNGDRESPGQQLPGMLAMLQEAIGQLHGLARELRPVGLDRSTLARVLEAYVTEFNKAHGLKVQFRPGAAETLRVPADVGTAIFRCVQEGLTNVARHARASEVVLSLTVDGGDLVVRLADNGVGIGARNTSDGEDHGLAGGLGLASIRERLEIVGGQLTILSGKAGTTLTMHAPLGGAA